MRLRLFALSTAVGLILVACDRGPATPTSGPTTSPTTSSAGDNTPPPAPAPPTPVPAPAPAHDNVLVDILDTCDPHTFNAALGPGTCTKAGGTTLAVFMSSLTNHHFVHSWQFVPNAAHIAVGQAFAATNHGGEVHTFTEVDRFGGGIVPALNQAGAFGATAPECNALEDDDFVQPGGTYFEHAEHAGALKFQCCIHPWMRLEATSR